MLRIAILLLLALTAHAQSKKAKGSMRSHEHGMAALNIVIDGKTAAIEFEAPAEGILGFEHAARTAAQKKQQEAALNVLRTKGGELVIFDAAIGCKFEVRAAEIEQEDGEEHSEVKAEYAVSCAEPLGGTKVAFGVTRLFPRVREVKVQLLNGPQQSGVTVTNGRGSIALAK